MKAYTRVPRTITFEVVKNWKHLKCFSSSQWVNSLIYLKYTYMHAHICIHIHMHVHIHKYAYIQLTVFETRENLLINIMCMKLMKITLNERKYFKSKCNRILFYIQCK